MSAPREIVPGVFVFTSAIFRMASGLVVSNEDDPGERRALLIDPGVLPAEVDEILAFVRSSGASPGHVVLTHSDWDHLSGAYRFSAPVVASERFDATREASSGEARREIAEASGGLPTGFRFPRASSLVGSESEIVGAARPARVLPARGHTPDGIALFLRDEGILFAGDYLSTEEIPFVEDSFAEYLKTLSRFRALLASRQVRWVVPGHGTPVETPGAIDVLDEDTAYLAALRDAAIAGHEAGRDARSVSRIVEPPREPSRPEVLQGHLRNAARALEEVQAAD